MFPLLLPKVPLAIEVEPHLLRWSRKLFNLEGMVVSSAISWRCETLDGSYLGDLFALLILEVLGLHLHALEKALKRDPVRVLSVVEYGAPFVHQRLQFLGLVECPVTDVDVHNATEACNPHAQEVSSNSFETARERQFFGGGVIIWIGSATSNHGDGGTGFRMMAKYGVQRL